MGRNTGNAEQNLSGQGASEVSLAFDKTFLDFFAGVGKISTQSLTLTNQGKTTVYFDWKRGPPNILFEFEKTDYAEYFHIHNGREVIKPGEQKTYTFTFYSALPGQFHAQYYIDTDPKLPEELPPIELSGFAVVSDKNIDSYRYQFDVAVRDYHVERFCSEIVEDVFTKVRTPTPPLPDYRILENRIKEFEVQNKALGLFYSEVSYQLFLLLQKHVIERAGLDPMQYAWGFRATAIKQWIDEMPPSINKTLLSERWEECVHISKKRPVDKSPSYQMFKDLLGQVAAKLPDLNEKGLEAQGGAKKKFKNEDEEQKFYAAHKEKLAEDLATAVADEMHFDEDFAMKKAIVDNKDLRFVHGPEYFDKLRRIKGFKECEIESKRVLAKFSLKASSESVLELKHPKVVAEDEADKKDPKKKGAADPKKDAKPDPKKAKTAPGKKDDEEESAKPVPIPKVKIGLEMIEEKSLEVFLKSVKSIQSRTPKLLMILVTLEDAELLGSDPEEVSIRFLLEKLNSYLETKVIWEKNWIIPDWADRLENEVYPEEGVILFENLALWPLELGYEVLEDPTHKQSLSGVGSTHALTSTESQVKPTAPSGAKPAQPAAQNPPQQAPSITTSVIPATRKYRCLHSHIAEGAKTISQYANTYVFDDPTNFGKRERLSNVYIRPESFGFGRMLTERLSFVLGFFKSLPGKSTLILGGDLNSQKLKFLQSCGHLFQNVVLVGEVGWCISKWITLYQPSIEHKPTSKDLLYREFISSLQEKTNLLLPRDAYVLPAQSKEETLAPVAATDPKKKPADPKDPKAAVRDESSNIDELGTARAALSRNQLGSHELELVSKHQRSINFRTFSLSHVEEYEAMLHEEAEQKKKDEAIRLEQERIKREEEAAKDPKKKAPGGAEKPKEPAGAKKPETKPQLDTGKTMILNEASRVSREIPPFHQQDGRHYYETGMTAVSWGQETRQTLLSTLANSNNIFWLGKIECCSAVQSLDKDVSKQLKTQRTAADSEEATLNAEARERYVGLKIGVVGESLISLVNSFDLKDPPPPKEQKQRRVADEDGEGEEEADEEELEEDEEEEDDFDDDLSSAEIRRIKKRDNIDQITGLYSGDEGLLLRVLSGEYVEELDRVDQAKKVVINPDDIDFEYLTDI